MLAEDEFSNSRCSLREHYAGAAIGVVSYEDGISKIEQGVMKEEGKRKQNEELVLLHSKFLARYSISVF